MFESVDRISKHQTYQERSHKKKKKNCVVWWRAWTGTTFVITVYVLKKSRIITEQENVSSFRYAQYACVNLLLGTASYPQNKVDATKKESVSKNKNAPLNKSDQVCVAACVYNGLVGFMYPNTQEGYCLNTIIWRLCRIVLSVPRLIEKSLWYNVGFLGKYFENLYLSVILSVCLPVYLCPSVFLPLIVLEIFNEIYHMYVCVCLSFG